MRIGIGIGRPESRDPKVVSNYVLGDIPDSEWQIIHEKVVPAISAHIQSLVTIETTPRYS
jgi:peptidyl-tRNA hydrolase